MTKTFLQKQMQIVRGLLTANKNRDKKIQDFLDSFIQNFNDSDKLNRNATPLAVLLEGLKKTDVSAISTYFEAVTNAKVGLNSMKHYTLQFDKNNKDRELKTNENYDTIKWFMTIEKTKKEPAESFKNFDAAKKAVENTLTKALKTVKGQEELDQLIAYINEIIARR